nr:MAG TPA: hypothetical protein [Caudoviricetes sp.]
MWRCDSFYFINIITTYTGVIIWKTILLKG